MIEKIRKDGTIILNRDDKFFGFLSKKANLFKLKVVTFGKHKQSDIQLKKVLKKIITLKFLLELKIKH